MVITDDVKLKLDAIERVGCVYCGASITITETRKGVLFTHAAAPERGIWSKHVTWDAVEFIGAENLRQHVDKSWAQLHGLRER